MDNYSLPRLDSLDYPALSIPVQEDSAEHADFAKSLLAQFVAIAEPKLKKNYAQKKENDFMGLAVSVGQLADLLENDAAGADWFRTSLAGVNAVLAENKLPPHVEPERLPAIDDRTPVSSYPYSFLHYLRRVAAHAKQTPGWIAKPFPESEDAATDPVVDEEMAMMESHLLCHSDCEGFYLPIDFKEVIVDTNGDRIPGGLLGSSHMLMKELIAIAPALGIHLNNGMLGDAEVEKINTVINQEGPLNIEKMVWISLFEAARLSIQHKTAICFA